MAITLDGTNGITAPAVTNNGAYTGDGISFADGTPSNTLVTTTGGNVGIGTSSPTRNLTITSSGNTTLQVTNSTSGTTAADGFIVQQNGLNTFVLNQEVGALYLGTSNAERMTIDSSGNLLVGTTTAVTTNVAGVMFAKVGTQGRMTIGSTSTAAQDIAYFFNPNGIVGSIQTNGSSTSYVTSSDYRLKENIAPMTGALATVAQLKPVTYTWKADGSAGQGFIAHELQAVVPDCVTGEKDAVELVDIKDEEGNVIGQEERPVYQGIDTSFLVATLTAAIQELKAELDTVKTELATLKGTV